MTVRNAGLLSVIGGIVVVIGGFMPVLQLTGPNGVASIAGTKAGVGVLFLGGFAVLKGASALRSAGLSERLSSPLITAGLLAALLVWRWTDIQDAIPKIAASYPGVTASVGFGYWLDVAGTVLIATGGLLLLRAKRAR